jgi:toxin ParE1/3/4
MVQIKIAKAAKKDIKNIFDYIKKDSVKNSEAVVDAILRKIQILHKQPNFGKIVKEYNKPNLRELKLFKYRIIYRLETSTEITVITIHHSSRLLNNNPHLKDFLD